ncbi:MAG: glycine--tRNA ligase subunit alpha [Fimbriimonas ginsengisoli]|uniref:Glycine--tRNA ligase alpha subunit n=1 Tax=Fimbriimonas ginsengisoli TaxID=1005039 RepID=A0A931LUD7_FIMGI|nr:glycine--tRNA ligase subunit alpha [Fimbriimonas ginsengisoli]
MLLQDLIARLNDYWSSKGCAILQPYDMEVGAGTMHPATALRSLGPEPWNVAYVQPSRRPADGRYTRNPQRNQRYYQYQVILKPSPNDVVDQYMGSLEALGFDTKKNDIRLVEDDWESPSLGASGVGWEVWMNGAEITQFTFFQQMGGIECNPVSAEITYGPERLCLLLDGKTSFWTDLEWAEGLSYRKAEYELEMQHNVYNFEVADTAMLFQLFELYEAESKRTIETAVFWDAEQGILTATKPEREPTEEELAALDTPLALVYPAFDLALRCSHVFNILDARGAVGVNQRADYINRVRARVRACCLRATARPRAEAKSGAV